MTAFFEIAYAAASNRLCLFTGTGFSKAVTSNSAPSWQDLLLLACDKLDNPTSLKDTLFPETGNNPVSLEEAAQIIAINLENEDKDIRAEIAKIISVIELSGDNSILVDFFAETNLNIVTTNYDKLAEKLSEAGECHSLSPGLPIPRSIAKNNVYHVHGSIDSPQNMVVTSDDYFNFLSGESYFSRKLSTMLHENTVVILGYSLSDHNLKTILNEYNRFSKVHSIGKNMFFVSRGGVDKCIKDYYAHCYGIRVLDNTTIHDFFEKLKTVLPEAKKNITIYRANISKVLSRQAKYNDSYLSVESSFVEIVSSISAVGKSINDPNVAAALQIIIEQKVKLTRNSGAWEQYEHLSRWLVYLGTILELSSTNIEKMYLDTVVYSMENMSSKYMLGRSWRSYNIWSAGWPTIIASNRALIKRHVEKETGFPDALKVVRIC